MYLEEFDYPVVALKRPGTVYRFVPGLDKFALAMELEMDVGLEPALDPPIITSERVHVYSADRPSFVVATEEGVHQYTYPAEAGQPWKRTLLIAASNLSGERTLLRKYPIFESPCDVELLTAPPYQFVTTRGREGTGVSSAGVQEDTPPVEDAQLLTDHPYQFVTGVGGVGATVFSSGGTTVSGQNSVISGCGELLPSASSTTGEAEIPLRGLCV